MFSKRTRKDEVPLDFQNLIRRATELDELGNFEGLIDLQKTVWRRLQSELMLKPYISDDHDVGMGFEHGQLLFYPSSRYGHYWEYCDYEYENEALVLNFSSDIVIPNPWHPNRIIRNLGSIGTDLRNGPFKQTTNHSVEYCWPLCVGLVTGGNHSMAQAIIRGEGSVKPEALVDLSSLINRIRFTGLNWVDIETGDEISSSAKIVEIGWSWEIGRLLLKYPEAYKKHILMRS
ncbi:DUF6710 family protein [Vibrio tapetis]|uniref:Putative Fip n=1 Tax=Vibrio tapetis subsp. tapetis TaxID=1671868 RepID=A0A2N8ZAL4_9VIBR|nr:DUF6710 family protein [Vibrio tapetis]SON48965.1 putative Fip [Vibrio tapetis subsp. tapetis]